VKRSVLGPQGLDFGRHFAQAQARREVVFALPVAAQPAQDSAQNVAGQMGHAHMGQNKKAAIVNYERQSAKRPLSSLTKIEISYMRLR